MVEEKNRIRGKKSRAAGGRFELKVRADLEKNWIVDKWSNNVEINLKGCGELIPVDPSDKNSEGWSCGQYYDSLKKKMYCGKCRGKLVKVKNKFLGPGKPMMLGAGFPDFICFKTDDIYHGLYEVIGVESKMNGYLDKEEKEKCKWLLKNNIFSKILIAKKGKKRGEIVYTKFK